MNKRTRALSVIVGLIVSVSILCAPSFAFQNEPEWLRVYKWGTPIKKDTNLKMTRLPQSNEAKHYHLNLYAVSGVTHDGSMFMFATIRGKLEAAAMIDIPDKKMSAFEVFLKKELGHPTQTYGRSLTWQGKRSTVMLSGSEHAFLMGSRKGMRTLGKTVIKEGR